MRDNNGRERECNTTHTATRTRCVCVGQTLNSRDMHSAWFLLFTLHIQQYIVHYYINIYVQWVICDMR